MCTTNRQWNSRRQSDIKSRQSFFQPVSHFYRFAHILCSFILAVRFFRSCFFFCLCCCFCSVCIIIYIFCSQRDLLIIVFLLCKLSLCRKREECERKKRKRRNEQKNSEHIFRQMLFKNRNFLFHLISSFIIIYHWIAANDILWNSDLEFLNRVKQRRSRDRQVE